MKTFDEALAVQQFDITFEQWVKQDFPESMKVEQANMEELGRDMLSNPRAMLLFESIAREYFPRFQNCLTAESVFEELKMLAASGVLHGLRIGQEMNRIEMPDEPKRD